MSLQVPTMPAPATAPSTSQQPSLSQSSLPSSVPGLETSTPFGALADSSRVTVQMDPNVLRNSPARAQMIDDLARLLKEGRAVTLECHGKLLGEVKSGPNPMQQLFGGGSGSPTVQFSPNPAALKGQVELAQTVDALRDAAERMKQGFAVASREPEAILTFEPGTDEKPVTGEDIAGLLGGLQEGGVEIPLGPDERIDRPLRGPQRPGAFGDRSTDADYDAAWELDADSRLDEDRHRRGRHTGPVNEWSLEHEASSVAGTIDPLAAGRESRERRDGWSSVRVEPRSDGLTVLSFQPRDSDSRLMVQLTSAHIFLAPGARPEVVPGRPADSNRSLQQPATFLPEQSSVMDVLQRLNAQQPQSFAVAPGAAPVIEMAGHRPSVVLDGAAVPIRNAWRIERADDGTMMFLAA